MSPRVSRAGIDQRSFRENGFGMKIYIAAPLFCESEKVFNEKTDRILRECGHETYLPQRDAGCVADLPEFIDGVPSRVFVFREDCRHMDWCDICLILMDGRVPDEGACFELSYCYHAGKRCIGYSTDVRSFIDGHANAMLVGSLETVLNNEAELKDYFSSL